MAGEMHLAEENLLAAFHLFIGKSGQRRCNPQLTTDLITKQHPQAKLTKTKKKQWIAFE